MLLVPMEHTSWADKVWSELTEKQLHAFDILVIPGGGKGVETFCNVSRTAILLLLAINMFFLVRFC
jgi:hypothetical protein